MAYYNFVYNYGFLSDWKKKNPNVPYKEILINLNMADYGTLMKWFNGTTMMPLGQLMRFCNAYTVPLTAFFLDEKAKQGDVIPPIFRTAQICPTGGWPAQERNGIKVRDPRTSDHQTSVLPQYVQRPMRRPVYQLEHIEPDPYDEMIGEGRHTAYCANNPNAQRQPNAQGQTNAQGQPNAIQGDDANIPSSAGSMASNVVNPPTPMSPGTFASSAVNLNHPSYGINGIPVVPPECPISARERMKYLDTISKLTDRVLELSRETMDLKQRLLRAEHPEAFDPRHPDIIM